MGTFSGWLPLCTFAFWHFPSTPLSIVETVRMRGSSTNCLRSKRAGCLDILPLHSQLSDGSWAHGQVELGAGKLLQVSGRSW